MTDYQQGFDDGYAYLIAYIEQWIDSNSHDPRSVYPVQRMLEELKQQEENL
jgi:hypothetical protein